eukprot:121015-Prymnesium_polylepis.1
MPQQRPPGSTALTATWRVPAWRASRGHGFPLAQSCSLAAAAEPRDAAAPLAASSSAPVDKKMQEQEYETTEYNYKRYNVCGMRFETTMQYA